MTYLDFFPNDLFSSLFLYFSWKELLYISVELRGSKLSLEKWPISCWKTIWKRDVSIYIDLPVDPYNKYVEIFNRFDLGYRREDIIYYLTYKGYEIPLYLIIKNHDYGSILITASEYGHIHVIRYILSISGEMHIHTIMCTAERYGHIEIIKEIIEWRNGSYNDPYF